MLRLVRCAAPSLFLALGVPACSGDSTATSSGTGSGATTSGTGSGSGSDASTSGSGSGSGSTSGSGTDASASGSGSGSTSGALPPECMATSECGGGLKCIKKPCDAVMNEPGCGVFRCYEGCIDPIVGDPWVCADEAACCGGYPCMGGLCTEVATSG